MHAENDKALGQADVRKGVGWIEIDGLAEISNRRAYSIGLRFDQ